MREHRALTCSRPVASAALGAVVSLLCIASGCRAGQPAPVDAAGQPEEALRRRIQSVAERIPARPENRELADEWCGLKLYFQKALFLLNTYSLSDPVTNMVAAELGKAEASLARLKMATPLPFVAGLREEAYFSANDESFQPFVRYVPAGSADGVKMPMLVFLHCYSPDLNIVNWDYIPTNLVGFARENRFCVVAPFARSNTDFQGIGEQDVLNAVSEMKRRYRVDEDRIVLCGISMGGMGAWTIGAHYPDMFAGILVISGRGDYYFWQKVKRDDLPSYKRTLIDAEFGFSLLPNLKSVPIFCAHGALDTLVPVEEARHMMSAVRRVNREARYLELQDGDHWIYEDVLARKDVREWLLARRRTVPAEFEYVSYHPMYDGCHWVRATGMSRGEQPARIVVRKESEGIRLETSGIAEVVVDRLLMPAGLTNLPVRGQCRIEMRAGAPRQTALSTAAAVGPVKQAFLGPFVFVFAGRGKDARASSGFVSAVRDWYAYAKARPKLAAEDGISEGMLASLNVFLFGEPEASALIRKVLDASPIKATSDSFVIGDRSYARKGHGLFFVYRSPWNAGKLAVVQCGIPWGEGLPSNHKYDFLPDYIVYSGEPDADGSNTALCAGFFDDSWNIAGNLMYTRPDKVRLRPNSE